MKSFYEYKKLGLVFLMGLLIFSFAGCTGTGNGTNTNNNFPVVVFSDVHFNPFYDPTLFSKLVAADADQWAGIFQTSKITAPSEWGADTNYPLLALALSRIKQNMGKSPLIIYTGDILGHNFPKTFFELYGSQNPPSDADVAAMKNFTDKTGLERQSYFARVFKGLGHQMHLIQDMSVPAHVRNDAHPEDALFGKNYLTGDPYFETWAKKNPSIINSFASNPTFPQVPLNINHNGLAPITQFIDAEQYNMGISPSISLTLGLSEYANSNFVSDDTIFTEQFSQSDRHYFPYPRYSTQCYETFEAVDISTNKKRIYLKKTCEGERVNRFVTAGPLFKYLSFNWDLQRLTLKLDSSTHNDYAEKLIPRAVGYSAGLLNYFFRGDIKLTYETTPFPDYVIVNNTNEQMYGTYRLFYDNIYDERIEIWRGSGTLEANERNNISFMPPSDPKEPGEYTLVFKGKLGNEEGAVAGYVFQRTLEIRLPDQSVYSMYDPNSGEPAEFTEIKAKIRNTTGEDIQNGTLQAVVMYKNDIDEQEFSYAISEPIAVSSLNSSEPTEFEFDFTIDPIPVGATDLYLQVIFTGKIGNENNAVIVGFKDISEPTPIDLLNDMDRVCLYGSFYVAGSPEAIDQFDTDKNGIADKWDVYAHDLKDIYIRFSPEKTPQKASPTEYQFHVPSLEAGKFLRALYVLTDYNFNNNFYSTWVKKDPKDPWLSLSGAADFYPDFAIKNQREYVLDDALCAPYGGAPCYITWYPTFLSYRGIEIWWGAGVMFINNAYPPDSECSCYEGIIRTCPMK